MPKAHPHVSELSPEFALLGFLYLEPLHGYQLHRRLEANLREVWRIPQNQAYNILKRLEKEGLIRPDRAEAPDPRAPVLFTLTGAGRAAFERWLFTPTPCSARALRVEFLTRLFFASHMGEDLASRLMQDQDAAVQAAIARLGERLAAVPPDQVFNRLSLDLRIRQLNTLRTWLQASEATLV
jgi:DNA-binding PadR family transcriptional regulator